MSHLSQIGKLFKMYSMDHGGNYPQSWQDARDWLASWPEYNSDKIFICPQAGQKPGRTNQVDSWCSFVLVTGLSTNSPKDGVHAFCRPENHQGKGANVLFTDGSVCWYQTEEFDKFLNEQGIDRPQQRRP